MCVFFIVFYLLLLLLLKKNIYSSLYLYIKCVFVCLFSVWFLFGF